MRKGLQNLENNANKNYKIIAVDDEEGIIDSLSIFLKRSGYEFVGVTNPEEAVEKVRNEHFDLMVLDFIMTPIHGDQVVEEIREFNKDLYILLLIESGIKSIKQMYEIKKINSELSDTYEKLESAYLESIQTLRYTVEAKDTYTRGHSDRVSEYSVLIGKHLGLPDADIENLRLGGLFHDIGKIGVPDSILQKEAKLTDDEYSQIKQHPNIGVHILSHAKIFKDILPIVEHHHEKYDGSGYPGKLKGENIPYLARITAIADSFDAMNSKRSYRDPLPIEVIISEFERCRVIQFDPEIDDVFLDILKNHYDEIKEIQEKHKA